MADVFVDPSAANNGDGTTAAQAATPGGVGAYNMLESANTTRATGNVWIRRLGTDFTGVNLIYNYANSNIHYYGWPKPGDSNYPFRHALGTSAGWDADTADYARVQFSGNGIRLTGAGLHIRRCWFEDVHATGRLTNAFIAIPGDDWDIRDCKFDETNVGDAFGNSKGTFLVEATSDNGVMSDVIITAVVSGGAQGAVTILGTGHLIRDLTIIGEHINAYCCYIGCSDSYVYGLSVKFANSASSKVMGVFTYAGNRVFFQGLHLNAKYGSTATSRKATFLAGSGCEIIGGIWAQAYLTLLGNIRRFILDKYDATGQGAVASALDLSFSEGNDQIIQINNADLSESTVYDINMATKNISVLLHHPKWGVNPSGGAFNFGASPYRMTKIVEVAPEWVVSSFVQTQPAGYLQHVAVNRLPSVYHGSVYAKITDVNHRSGRIALELNDPVHSRHLLHVRPAVNALIVHFGHKNFVAGTEPGLDDFWMECRYIGASGSEDRVSSRGISQVADAIWSSDGTINAYKVNLPVVIGYTGLVVVSFHFAWAYAAAGDFYLDPEVTTQ